MIYFTFPFTVPYLLYGYASSLISASIPISKDGAAVDSQQIIDAITNIGFGAAEADETKQEIE